MASLIESLHESFSSATSGVHPSAVLDEAYKMVDRDDAVADPARRVNMVVGGPQRDFLKRRARARAVESDARFRETSSSSGGPRGLLDGIPITVKDIASQNVAGCETTNGSWFCDEAPQPASCLPVRLLEGAGAVICARTTTPEYGFKGTTSSPRYGVTRNPLCPWLTPGGSSGGAAASVAAGMVPAALGSDGGGSIRIPAACCGMFGFKPSIGVVGTDVPESVLSHNGPITKTVTDAAIVMDVIQGLPRGEPVDGTAALGARHDFAFRSQCVANPNGLRGLRVAVSTSMGGSCRSLDHRVESALWLFIDRHVKPVARSVTVVDDELSEFIPKEHNALFGAIWVARTAHHPRLGLGKLSAAERKRVDPGFNGGLALAKGVSGPQISAAYAYCYEVKEKFHRFFDNYDVLLTPTLPTLPPRALPCDEEVVDVKRRDGSVIKDQSKWNPSSFTSIFNVTGQPAASINIGFAQSDHDSPGRGARVVPIGMQVVGALNKDDLVFRACYAIECAVNAAEEAKAEARRRSRM